MKAFWVAVFLALCGVAGPVCAQELSALARLDAAKSAISDSGSGLDMTLALSQPVPWRLRFLDDPARISSSVLACMVILPAARATRAVSALLPTSTIWAWPALSK